MSPIPECIWTCSRGRTSLCCQMRAEEDDGVLLEVLRNRRLYGAYRFTGRTPALSFAARLRFTFEGNGWIVSQS